MKNEFATTAIIDYATPDVITPSAVPRLTGDLPAQLTFLEPIGSYPARKAHRLIQRGDGSAELKTAGYGKAKHFRHCSAVVADVDDLFAALEANAPHNRFAIRGQVRPDAGPVINRQLAGDNPDIVDAPSTVVAVDLDCEVAPATLDTADILAVGEYLRSRLPTELAGASCVVQLSGSYGLWQFKPGPRLVKARLWFVNDAPLDGPQLRRWFKAMNATGSYAVMDTTVAGANQAIYTAAPLFSGMTDPVPTRLALLLSGDGIDVASIRPPPAPDLVVYAPGAVGQRCPARLSLLVRAIQRATEQGLPRHPAINSAAFTAGRMVAGGAFTADEARAVLLPAALATGSAGGERAINDGLAAGMKASPILIGAARIDDGVPVADPLPTAEEAAAALDSKLTEFFDAVKAGSSQKLAVAGAAGLGKTTRALALATERGLTVDHFVPTQKLAQEQVDRLPAGVAIAIRGRTHQDENRAPLCAKFEAAESLQAAGLGEMSQVFLCGKYDHSQKQFPCPYSRGCGYHAQFNSSSPVRFYSHEWLTIQQKERPGFKTADVAVVDESFSAGFEIKHRWGLESIAETGGLFYEIADAIRNDTLNQADHSAAIDAALKVQTGHSFPPVHPEMTAQEAAQAARQWQSLPRTKQPPYDLLRAARDVIKSGESKRLYAETLNDKTTIYFDAVKPLAIESAAWLFLDASLIPSVVNAVVPGTEIVTIQARRNARFVQITDCALGKGRLAANNNFLMSRIAEFAERLKLGGGQGAVIGPKDFMDAAINAGHFTGLVTGHYGALRGLNTMEQCDWLIQIGRNEPPVWAVERKARAWFSGDGGLQLGTVQRATGWLHGIDGAVETGLVTTFGDGHCQEILESLREQESLQGIDRLRLVHAKAPKTVYLLSNLPLPGIRPDVLTTLDRLMLPGRLAEVLLRDKAITGAAMLAARHPDLFENQEQAKCTLRTLQWVNPLLGIYIGSLPIEALTAPIGLVPVNYRTGSQKGGKPRKALLYEKAAAAPLLTALHGETVALREADPPPVVVVAPVVVIPATDSIVANRAVLRGVCTAHGTTGRVSGTGRIIGIAPPVTEPTAVPFIRAPATLRGRCTAHGQAGSAAGAGRLTLVGKGTATGIPATATATPASKSTTTALQLAALTTTSRASFHPDRIPDELKAIPQWVCWRWSAPEKEGGRFGKPPIDAKTGKAGKSNDPATWSTFDVAVARFNQDGKMAGIGLALTPELGLTAIDADHVIDPETGAVDPKAADLLAAFQTTYCEVSPSGTGYRLFCYGKPRREGHSKPRWLELYTGGGPRYMTVTGNAVDGHQRVIAAMQPELDWLHTLYMGDPEKTTSKAGTDTQTSVCNPADRLAMALKNSTIAALYGGDTGKYGDKSTAEIALALRLMTFADGDMQTVSEWMDGSRCEKWLQRDKDTDRVRVRNTKPAPHYAVCDGGGEPDPSSATKCSTDNAGTRVTQCTPDAKHRTLWPGIGRDEVQWVCLECDARGTYSKGTYNSLHPVDPDANPFADPDPVSDTSTTSTTTTTSVCEKGREDENSVATLATLARVATLATLATPINDGSAGKGGNGVAMGGNLKKVENSSGGNAGKGGNMGDVASDTGNWEDF